MPTFYCNYFLLGTRGPLTLGGPLDFAYPAYPIVTPLDVFTVLTVQCECISKISENITIAALNDLSVLFWLAGITKIMQATDVDKLGDLVLRHFPTT